MWSDIAGWWDRFGDWLAVNEEQSDLWSVWLIVISLLVLAMVKLVTWWTIRNQRDRTDAGRALKGQKMAETWMFVAFAILYSLSLWVYYTGTLPVNLWGRMAIRAVVAGGSVVSAVQGIRFVLALREQHFGLPDEPEVM